MCHMDIEFVRQVCVVRIVWQQGAVTVGHTQFDKAINISRKSKQLQDTRCSNEN